MKEANTESTSIEPLSKRSSRKRTREESQDDLHKGFGSDLIAKEYTKKERARANKLKVDELRAELTKKDLDVSGTKPTLVERLVAVLVEENREKISTNEGDSGLLLGKTNGRKRARKTQDDGVVTAAIHNDNEDSNVHDEKNKEKYNVDVETLRGMGVRELREQASIRGLLATGTKKQLLERLLADLHKGPNSINRVVVDDGEASEVKEEILVKATKKGGAVSDQYLPEEYKANYHVLEHGGEIYCAMLNQTNVSSNNNKFYMIQALESNSGGAFMVFTRWGRVGVEGQNKLHGPYTSRDEAIKEFELKFYDKTKNLWSSRMNFVSRPKLYTWLEMDHKEKEIESAVPERLKDSSIQPRETKLESRIAKFISLICDVSMMKQQMIEIGYDAEKFPLGKLSKSTILKGYNVLKSISEAITANPDRETLEKLSGTFYSVIPHDFGFKNMREFIVDTPQKLQSKIEMVDALAEIEHATKLLEDGNDMLEDPLYSYYNRLQCELTAIDADSKEYSVIEKYMRNTHAKTHSKYTVDIVQLFRVSRLGEDERFGKFSNTKNRMLLWHGSPLTNWTTILSQGLRIAPPEVPSSGYMFGKGVYFADMFSKSANYCSKRPEFSRDGVLLLCEVALGEMAELLHSNYDADWLPEGKLSTKGVGATAPDPSEFQELDDGVVVPLGMPKEQLDRKGSLLYNEYIVYNVDQIRMRYLIHINFNYKK